MNIIETTDIVILPNHIWILSILCVAAFPLICYYIFSKILKNNYKKYQIIIYIILVISIIGELIFISLVPKISTGRYIYIVELDDTYSVSDLLEKYDIINYSDNTLTIVDK